MKTQELSIDKMQPEDRDFYVEFAISVAVSLAIVLLV